MFKIKSFQRRILFALLSVALVPTAVILLVGTQALREVVQTTGTAGPWSSVAESGQALLEEVEAAGLENPAISAAADAHRVALTDGLRGSLRFSLVSERFMGLVPFIALGLALVVVGLSFWVARQLSRGFSRPIRDLVGWTEIIAHDEPLPRPDPRGHRGVQEFALLRDALRKMADELKEGRREAVQAAKLRSWTEMGRRVAHELKNPLTPMRLAASTVSRMEGEAAREAGGILLEEIDRLDEMARTFSQFGRMPEGPSSQVDLVELLESLVKQHVGEGAGRGTATIHFQVENGLMVPRVEGHFDALLRVFRNLLLNAVDAAGPNGEVSVSAGGTPELAKVQIRDSGPGIAQEDLDRIWDPEFTTKSQGTGLGLPLVKQTILFHHGRVDGRNHPEGGAVFVVELPKEGVLAKE